MSGALGQVGNPAGLALLQRFIFIWIPKRQYSVCFVRPGTGMNRVSFLVQQLRLCVFSPQNKTLFQILVEIPVSKNTSYVRLSFGVYEKNVL